MIKYENIAAERLCVNLYDRKLNETLKSYEVKSVQDVIDLKDELRDYNWSKIDLVIKDLTKSMNLCNKRNKEPVIYETDYYEDSSLEYTDSLNKGDVLLLANPTSYINAKYRALDNLTMAKIKDYLRLTYENGENYLYRSCRNIGEGSIPNILDAIKLYDEQVSRQAELTDSRDINVFTYQKQEKDALTKENYIDIIDYLLDTAEELVWGCLSDNQRKLYLSTIDNRRESDKKLKKRIINNISNYTTLEELEKVNRGHYKVLNRFIRK